MQILNRCSRLVAARLSLAVTLAVLPWACAVSSASAQIALVGATSSSSDGTTLDYAHTVDNGIARLLVVAIVVDASTPANSALTALPTFDGVPLTLAVDRVTTAPGGTHTYLYYMLDSDLPPAGAYTVSIAADNADNVISGAISVVGAAQQAPEATASNADTQEIIQSNITTLTDNAWLFDCVGSSAPAAGFLPGLQQTEHWDTAASSSRAASSTKIKAVTGASSTAWRQSSSASLCHVVAAFAAAECSSDATCDDGVTCTNDVCVGGLCVSSAQDGQCDDDNPCTDDTCDALLDCQYSTNSASCDDGSACTTIDVCSNGTCVGSVPPDCDDGNPCTDDTCVALTGCVNSNNASACDDGQACTTSDTCNLGSCSGVPVDCTGLDDDCTLGVCNVDTGTCEPQSVNEGEPCDDGALCTTGDQCSLGVCAGSAIDCSGLDDTCAVGVCNPTTGTCQPQPTNDGGTCDDGNICSTNDVCAAGQCVGDAIPGCQTCTTAADCVDANPCTDESCPAGTCVYTANSAACDDGNACTTTDTCAGGMCVGGAPPDCTDGNDCTDDTCDGLLGCQNTPNNDPCDDGNACTSSDTCAGGSCIGGRPRDCDDGNACTDDSCDAGLGCQNIANVLPCDDGNACTTADVCAGGSCTGGPPPNCDDGNPCTDDSCDPAGGCITVDNTAPCDDGLACTVADVCADGVCSGTPLDCSHLDDVCTVGVCNTTSGLCEALPVNDNGACDDADLCTTSDVCAGGTCVGTAVDCSGLNDSCNVGVCQPGTGSCQSEPTNEGGSCNDGNTCTTNDICTSGTCAGDLAPGCQTCVTAAECDDTNPCTDDSCPAGACVHTTNAAACNDGNACTTADTCAAGVCIGGAPPDCNDGNGCTDDSCDVLLGCRNIDNRAPCDDNDACTTNDACAGGVCAGGPPLLCDDGNPCTDDSCDAVAGCQATNNIATCDDGDACTTADTCAGGACIGGPAPNCDDGNPCTDDSCSSALGCQNMANVAPCDDGNACTTLDTCGGGSCLGGPGLNCDDGNPCTDDSCDNISGCLNIDNAVSCDDGDACTTGDTCVAGACIGGAPPDCADGNVCTDDVCDIVLGCQNLNNTAACDDGIACTLNDVCTSGACMGMPLDCSGLSDSCNDGVCNEDNGQCEALAINEGGSCEDGLFCNGAETCTAGSCAAADDPCDANPNFTCDEVADVCVNECLFDCNLNTLVDTGDYSYFLGCFATFIDPGDFCECADYNSNGAGDTGDYAGLLGCFGIACPCPSGGPAPLVAPLTDVRIIVRRQATASDYAEELPTSLRTMTVGDQVVAEVWVSVASTPADMIACALTDIACTPQLAIDHATASEAFPVFDLVEIDDERGLASNLGGCVTTDPSAEAVGATWARVATLDIEALHPGIAEIMPRAASLPFVGLAVVGQDHNLEPSTVTYHGARVLVRDAATGRSKR